MRYHQITAEPGKLSKPFIPVGKGGIHRQACCDCGLVHNKRFTAWLKVPGGYRKLKASVAVVMIEVGRNAKATAARRRTKKVKAKLAKLRTGTRF